MSVRFTTRSGAEYVYDDEANCLFRYHPSVGIVGIDNVYDNECVLQWVSSADVREGQHAVFTGYRIHADGIVSADLETTTVLYLEVQ